MFEPPQAREMVSVGTAEISKDETVTVTPLEAN